MKKRKKSQDKRWKTTIWIFFTFVYNYPLSSNPCNFQCTFDTENRHGAIGVKRRPEAPDDRSSRFVDYRFSVAAESTIRESQQFAGSVHTAQVHVTSSGWYRFSERVEPATTWHDDVKEVTFRTSGVRKAHFGHFSATGLSIRERRRQTISVRLREEFSEGGGVGGGGGGSDTNSIRFESAYAAQWLRPLKLDSWIALRGNLLCWLLDQRFSIGVFHWLVDSERK